MGISSLEENPGDKGALIYQTESYEIAILGSQMSAISFGSSYIKGFITNVLDEDGTVCKSTENDQSEPETNPGELDSEYIKEVLEIP